MASGSSPCACCKLLRRRCTQECIFAPYFPSDDLRKFAIVHKVFGASNVTKMLQELPINQRAETLNSLVYEADARIRDPVYGCVGAILYLQTQVSQLQMQLAMAQAEILCIQMQQDSARVTNTLPAYNDQDDRLMLLSEYSNCYGDVPQYINFPASSSSSSSNVFQDFEPFKRESFGA